MKKVLVLVGSNHTVSVNRQLAEFASSKLTNAEIEIVDLVNFDIPMFGIDEEKANGHPQKVVDLISKFKDQDGLIIASPEHNGMLPAVFKNLIDWMSRVEKKFFGDKPVLLLSTSPGGKGAASNLHSLERILPWFGGNPVASFSLPGFYKNFVDRELSQEFLPELKAAMQQFEKHLAENPATAT